MEETFYRKVGGKYVPVKQYDDKFCKANSIGTTLTVVRKDNTGTMTTFRYGLTPEFAPLVAAGVYVQDALAHAIMKAGEARPRHPALNQTQLNAWDNLKKVYNDEMYSIEFPSSHEVAQKALEQLAAEAEKMLTHPTVKAAYEQFLMVVELVNQTKETQ